MESNFMGENPLASLALAILLIYVLKLIWNATADKCHQKKEPQAPKVDHIQEFLDERKN